MRRQLLKLEAKALAEAVAKKIAKVVAKSVAQRFEKRFSKSQNGSNYRPPIVQNGWDIALGRVLVGLGRALRRTQNIRAAV